jgi:hypothetical protein
MKLKWSEFLERRQMTLTPMACGLVAVAILQGCTVGPKLYMTSFTQ